jgi:hypothetical protein
MKLGKIRTLRGQLTPPEGASSAKRQLIVEDGRLNIGYRVTSFQVWPADYDVNLSYQASLSVSNSGSDELDASNSSQIAWVLGNYYLSTLPATLDPEHIVNQELYIRTKFSDPFAKMNYLIEMVEVSLSDDEAIITIVKNSQQNTIDSV